MIAVWANELQNQMNTTLAFALDLDGVETFQVKLAAADCYKIYLDGQFFAFGPQRAAHGYARVADYTGKAKRIVVEVHSHFVQTFCWIKQPPFFACEVVAGGKNYTAEDFTCYHVTDRVQKVQRYSFQRAFSEIYRMDEDRTSLYVGQSKFPKKQTQRVHAPVILPSLVDEPKYKMHYPQAVIERGGVAIDPNLPVLMDRFHTLVGTVLQGYVIGDWDERLTEIVSQFVYHLDKTDGYDMTYTTYDFGRAMTGFAELNITAERDGVVYVIFDELLWHECGKGKNHVAFERNTCSSVHKFVLKKGGRYSVSTFEPYLMRYALVVCTEGVSAEVALRLTSKYRQWRKSSKLIRGLFCCKNSSEKRREVVATQRVIPSVGVAEVERIPCHKMRALYFKEYTPRVRFAPLVGMTNRVKLRQRRSEVVSTIQ